MHNLLLKLQCSITYWCVCALYATDTIGYTRQKRKKRQGTTKGSARHHEVDEFTDETLSRGGDPEEIVKNEHHLYSYLYIITCIYNETGFIVPRLQVFHCTPDWGYWIKNYLQASNIFGFGGMKTCSIQTCLI